MTINIELNHKPHSNGLYCIFIRITDNKKHTRINSEIFIKKQYFKHKAKWGEWISRKNPKGHSLNRALEKKIAEIKERKDRGVTVRAAVRGGDFIAFALDFCEKYNNPEQTGTYKRYNVVINKLKEYAGDKIEFKEVTVEFLRKYVSWLRSEKKNDVNTYTTDLRKIRAVFNAAINEDLIDYSVNPFRKIKIETKRTTKQRLTLEELGAIRNLNLDEGGYIWHARNIFLFCLNCMGMRVGSALKLKSADIQGASLYYQMNKGGKSKNIELTGEALEIIGRYPERGKYLFPYLERETDIYNGISKATALINKGLKSIAEMAGIDKRLTTHISRHSFAKLANSAKVDVPTIQKMLGHSSIRTTQIYLGEISDDESNEALKKIFKS